MHTKKKMPKARKNLSAESIVENDPTTDALDSSVQNTQTDTYGEPKYGR